MPSQLMRVAVATGNRRIAPLRRSGLSNRALAAGVSLVIAGTAAAGGLLLSLDRSPRNGQIAQPPPKPALRADAPVIILPSRMVADAAMPNPLRVHVGPPHSVPPGSMLQVRGLPEAMALSQGSAQAPSVWAVPVAELTGLMLHPAAGTSGPADLEFELVTAEGVTLANARTTVTVLPAPGDAKTETAAAPSVKPTAAPPPKAAATPAEKPTVAEASKPAAKAVAIAQAASAPKMLDAPKPKARMAAVVESPTKLDQTKPAPNAAEPEPVTTAAPVAAAITVEAAATSSAKASEVAEAAAAAPAKVSEPKKSVAKAEPAPTEPAPAVAPVKVEDTPKAAPKTVVEPPPAAAAITIEETPKPAAKALAEPPPVKAHDVPKPMAKVASVAEPPPPIAAAKIADTTKAVPLPQPTPVASPALIAPAEKAEDAPKPEPKMATLADPVAPAAPAKAEEPARTVMDLAEPPSPPGPPAIAEVSKPAAKMPAPAEIVPAVVPLKAEDAPKPTATLAAAPIAPAPVTPPKIDDAAKPAPRAAVADEALPASAPAKVEPLPKPAAKVAVPKVPVVAPLAAAPAKPEATVDTVEVPAPAPEGRSEDAAKVGPAPVVVAALEPPLPPPAPKSNPATEIPPAVTPPEPLSVSGLLSRLLRPTATLAPGPAPVAPAPPPAPAVVAAIQPTRASNPPSLTQEQQQRAEKMIARGERDLQDGNISIARQFFLRAAEAGVARGALLLASTYDAHEFTHMRVHGVQPNRETARKWYVRARELGATEADDRLARLNAAK